MSETLHSWLFQSAANDINPVARIAPRVFVVFHILTSKNSQKTVSILIETASLDKRTRLLSVRFNLSLFYWLHKKVSREVDKNSKKLFWKFSNFYLHEKFSSARIVSTKKRKEVVTCPSIKRKFDLYDTYVFSWCILWVFITSCFKSVFRHWHSNWRGMNCH